MALALVIMKSYECLVLSFLKMDRSLHLDSLQFIYRTNQSVEDAVNMGLHYVMDNLISTGVNPRIAFCGLQLHIQYDCMANFFSLMSHLKSSSQTRNNRCILDLFCQTHYKSILVHHKGPYSILYSAHDMQMTAFLFTSQSN